MAAGLMTGCSSGPSLPTSWNAGRVQTVVEKDPMQDAAAIAAVGRSALSVVSIDTLHDSGTGIVVNNNGKKEVFIAAHVGFNSSRCGEYVITYQPTAPHAQPSTSTVKAQTQVVGKGGVDSGDVTNFNNGSDVTALVPDTVPKGIPAIKLPSSVLDLGHNWPGDAAYFSTYDLEHTPANQPPNKVGGIILDTLSYPLSKMVVAVPEGALVHGNSGSPMFTPKGDYEGSLSQIVGDNVSRQTVLKTYGVDLPNNPAWQNVEVMEAQLVLGSNLNPALGKVPTLIPCKP